MENNENSEKQGLSSDGTDEKQSRNSSAYTIEVPLKKDIIGKLIKALRKIRKYSQEKLGLMLGVQKSQISKLEKSDRNISLSSMIKVFGALKTKVSFKIELDKKKDLAMVQQILNEEIGESTAKATNA